MPNTITKTTILQRQSRVFLDIEIESDGTDETDLQLLDISTLTTEDGSTPTEIVVHSIISTISGFNYAVLETDQSTDQVVAVLPAGFCVKPFSLGGGKTDGGSGGNGDPILTTDGALDGGAISLFLELELKA